MRHMRTKFLESLEELVTELGGELVNASSMGSYRLYIHKDDKVVRSLHCNPGTDEIKLTDLRKGYNQIPCYGDGQWWIIEYQTYFDKKWRDHGTIDKVTGNGSIKIGGWPAFEALVREWMQ